MAGGTSVPAAYLRMSYDRFLSFLPKENILVVTLSSYAEVLRSILPDIPKENLLLEPYARQTAPCMAFAAYTLLRRDPEAVIIASPSDQIIRDEKLFVSTVTDALAYVQKENVLMTLGIVPKTPDVNFGYIQVTWRRCSSGPASSSGTAVSLSGRPPRSSPRWTAIFPK